jgi:hypothetical protein
MTEPACLKHRAADRKRANEEGRVTVSRILSVAEATGRPFLSSRSRGTPRWRGVRLIPGMCPACAGRPGRAVIPVLSCTARGLSCHDDHSSCGGLLPRLFNLTRRSGRYIFCDTFRGGGLAPAGPALARGVLPRGVRTFLCTGSTAQRPPATRHRETTPDPVRPQPPRIQTCTRRPDQPRYPFITGLWCNGNTAAFGAVIHGSSPCGPATSRIAQKWPPSSAL